MATVHSGKVQSTKTTSADRRAPGKPFSRQQPQPSSELGSQARVFGPPSLPPKDRISFLVGFRAVKKVRALSVNPPNFPHTRNLPRHPLSFKKVPCLQKMARAVRLLAFQGPGPLPPPLNLSRPPPSLHPLQASRTLPFMVRPRPELLRPCYFIKAVRACPLAFQGPWTPSPTPATSHAPPP